MIQHHTQNSVLNAQNRKRKMIDMLIELLDNDTFRRQFVMKSLVFNQFFEYSVQCLWQKAERKNTL